MSLVQSVRKLAAKYPDTVYPSGDVPYSRYTEGDCGAGAGCIIGQALQDCGMKDIAEYADNQGEMNVCSLLNHVKSYPLSRIKVVCIKPN